MLSDYGPGIAVDVHVSLDPPIPDDETSLDGQPSVARFIVERNAEPIPTFTPGMLLRNVYFVGALTEVGPCETSSVERTGSR